MTTTPSQLGHCHRCCCCCSCYPTSFVAVCRDCRRCPSKTQSTVQMSCRAGAPTAPRALGHPCCQQFMKSCLSCGIDQVKGAAAAGHTAMHRDLTDFSCWLGESWGAPVHVGTCTDACNSMLSCTLFLLSWQRRGFVAVSFVTSLFLDLLECLPGCMHLILKCSDLTVFAVCVMWLLSHVGDCFAGLRKLLWLVSCCNRGTTWDVSSCNSAGLQARGMAASFAQCSHCGRPVTEVLHTFMRTAPTPHPTTATLTNAEVSSQQVLHAGSLRQVMSCIAFSHAIATKCAGLGVREQLKHKVHAAHHRASLALLTAMLQFSTFPTANFSTTWKQPQYHQSADSCTAGAESTTTDPFQWDAGSDCSYAKGMPPKHAQHVPCTSNSSPMYNPLWYNPLWRQVHSSNS